MRAVAVNLDDQGTLRPEEIGNEWPDAHIHFRPGKAVAATEGEEAGLELASRVIRVEVVVDVKAKELCLTKGRGELLLGKGAAEIGEGAG